MRRSVRWLLSPPQDDAVYGNDMSMKNVFSSFRGVFEKTAGQSSGKDGLDWVTYMSDVMWPYARTFMIDHVPKVAQSRILAELQKRKGFSVTDVLVTFDPGSKPPKFSHLRTHQRPQDGDTALQIDVDIHFQSGPEFTVRTVVKGTGPMYLPLDAVPFGISAIELEGRLSLVMSPLMDDLPCIGVQELYFSDAPRIRVELGGLPAEASKLVGPCFGGFAVHFIEKTLNDTVVLPHRLVHAMRKDLSLETLTNAKSPLPLGVLEIEIFEAKGLIASDIALVGESTSDPFVRVQVGNRAIRTSTAPRTTNPTWKDGPDYLLVSSMQQHVRIVVFDNDVVKSDDVIGLVPPISVFWLCHEIEKCRGKEEFWLDLLHPQEEVRRQGAGRLRLSVRFLALSSSTIASRFVARLARGNSPESQPNTMLPSLGGVVHARESEIEPSLVTVKVLGIGGNDSSILADARCTVSIMSDDNDNSSQHVHVDHPNVAGDDQGQSIPFAGESSSEEPGGRVGGDFAQGFVRRMVVSMKDAAIKSLGVVGDAAGQARNFGFGQREFGVPTTQSSTKGKRWASTVESRGGLKVEATSARAVSHLRYKEGWDLDRIAKTFGIDVEAVKTYSSIRANLEVVWHEAFHFVKYPGKSPYCSKIQVEVRVPSSAVAACQRNGLADSCGFVGSCIVDLAAVAAGNAEGANVIASSTDVSSASLTPSALKPTWSCRASLPLRRPTLQAKGGPTVFQEVDAVTSNGIKENGAIGEGAIREAQFSQSSPFTESGVELEFVVEVRSLHHSSVDVLLEDDEPPPDPHHLTATARPTGVKVEFVA
eukprot:TRINITY_DN14111_c0_g1_i2.p1 TRINITY_DN14111_c0_g1~~TRINITY_DN14111_c0_g1_i2.p1  ORF type:complete len:818 (+),score=105.14 TRINITY_DN14111_c0_g1_i2:184-2637(+)